MMNETNNLKFSVNPEATASLHDDGIVILDTFKGRVFSSNKTGALIWRGIEQRQSFDGIVAEISGHFQIAVATARVHALNFLAVLEQHSLVKREVAS